VPSFQNYGVNRSFGTFAPLTLVASYKTLGNNTPRRSILKKMRPYNKNKK